MGGRKKTGKKEKKLRTYAIPKVFDCEKCSADQTLTISISKKQNKREAKIFCVKCKYNKKTEDVGALDSAIDVYNKWCENLHGEGGKDAYEDEGDDVDLDVGDDDIDLGDDDL